MVWTNLGNVTATGNTIQKTGGTAGSWDAGAVSSMQIASGEGYVQASADATNTQRMFGLGNGDASRGISDIEFAIYLDGGGGAYIYESGISKAITNTYLVNDVFKVWVGYDSGLGRNAVKYYKIRDDRTTLLYTSNVTPSYPLRMDTSIATANGQVYNAYICAGDLTAAPTATPTFTPTNTPLPCQTVVWTNLGNVTANNNTIQKTGGTAGSWDAGAVSSVEINSGEGYAQASADATNTQRMFGLGNGDASRGISDIEFAIYIDGGAGIYVYESGTSRGSMGTYLVNDIFKVWVGYDAGLGHNVVKYYKIRGSTTTLLYTSTVTPSYPLRMDTSIATSNGQVYNAYICGGNLTPIPTATPTFTPTNTPLPCQTVVWTSLGNVTATGNTIQKTGGTAGSWDAGAVSSVHINSGEGYVQASADATNTQRMFGLGNGDASRSFTDIEFAIYIDGGGGIYVYESGTSRGSMGTYLVNDIFKVWVGYDAALGRNAVKYYKIRGSTTTLLYTSNVTPSYPLLMDTSIATANGQVYNAYICGGDLGTLAMSSPTPKSKGGKSRMKAGDTNGDNVVNAEDAIILRRAYGALLSNARYDSRADFNNDGYINIVDFDLLRRNMRSVGAP